MYKFDSAEGEPKDLGYGSYTGLLNENGQPEGQGIMVFKNKVIYQGMFMNGSPEGHGILIYPKDHASGFVRFSGIVSGGEPRIGTMKYTDYTYTGKLLFNKKEGMGILKLNNGNMYSGLFKDDMQEGNGTWKWAVNPRNVVWKGEWHKGFPENGVWRVGSYETTQIPPPNNDQLQNPMPPERVTRMYALFMATQDDGEFDDQELTSSMQLKY